MTKDRFILELAEYLAGRATEMSCRLEANPEDPEVKQWVRLRQTTPLFGYATIEEAAQQLKEFLCR